MQIAAECTRIFHQPMKKMEIGLTACGRMGVTACRRNGEKGVRAYGRESFGRGGEAPARPRQLLMAMMLNDDYAFWATRPPTCPT